jgi:hypothetical protein
MILYHRVPKNFRGVTLYPLNQLKLLHPDLYDSFVANYRGRESVMEQIVPIFNCKWNDVLFLSPVAPDLIRQARLEEGIESNSGTAFMIESENLDPDKLLLYRHRPPWLQEREPEKEEYVRWKDLTQGDLEELMQVPKCARWAIKKFGSDCLFFGYVPHILYLGEIHTEGIPLLKY